MANAGYSADYRLVNSFDSRKSISIEPDDDPVMVLIKRYMNRYLDLRYLKRYQPTKVNDINQQMKNIIIKINQIRLKSWYFKQVII